jgi:hypothetical protein
MSFSPFACSLSWRGGQGEPYKPTVTKSGIIAAEAFAVQWRGLT